MHPHRRLIAGALVCLTAMIGQAAMAPAQEPLAAPTYSRMRMGAEDWQARGGNYGHVYGRGGHGFGYGFYQPYISPVIASSWYARPYPYHFDYFRGRWGGEASMMAPQPDCPCAVDSQPYAAEAPAGAPL